MQSIEQAQQELIEAYTSQKSISVILDRVHKLVRAVQGYEAQLDALMLELTDEDKQYIAMLGTPIQYEQYHLQIRPSDAFSAKWGHLQAMGVLTVNPIESGHCQVLANDIGKALARRIQEQIRKRKPDYD